MLPGRLAIRIRPAREDAPTCLLTAAMPPIFRLTRSSRIHQPLSSQSHYVELSPSLPRSPGRKSRFSKCFQQLPAHTRCNQSNLCDAGYSRGTRRCCYYHYMLIVVIFQKPHLNIIFILVKEENVALI